MLWAHPCPTTDPWSGGCIAPKRFRLKCDSSAERRFPACGIWPGKTPQTHHAASILVVGLDIAVDKTADVVAAFFLFLKERIISRIVVANIDIVIRHDGGSDFGV